MNLANSFMKCNMCESEFNRENYPVTLMCGHNLCFTCVSSLNKKNFVCERDNIKQDLADRPSLDFLNFIEATKSITDLYMPASKPLKIQDTFNPAACKKERICKFYLNGTCKFGIKCWNKHSYRFN